MPSPSSLTRAIALAMAATALLAAQPAHALGRLLDVRVIDRDSGAPLPVYRARGQWWVAGRPGARYAIEVRNPGGARVLGVMAVDGVNVISGETAAWNQTGYVLDGRQDAQITGWRKSDREVAAFRFTALPQSYAALTGRPGNVGVIGVAVFRESWQPPPAPPLAAPRSEATAEAAAPGQDLADSQAQASTPERKASARAQRAAPQLGTAHGERERSWVSHTEFERRRAQPDELIAIRYDSRENLIALGVIPGPGRPAAPQPFPDSPRAGYTPDPPGWR